MKGKVLETLGYVVNALSIVLYIFLVPILDVPRFLYPLRHFGWLFLAPGIVLIALSIVALVRNKGEGLIDGGIYGMVRHPMYLGAMLCFSSFFFFHPHWITLVISIVNLPIVYLFILQGDGLNIARFGQDYRRYMESVPRINLLAGIFKCLRSK
jgi:protein-S-isoprenylcysteine O-methyltransferase Ste14